LARRADDILTTSEAAIVGAFSGIFSFMAYATSIGTYKVDLARWIAILGPGIIYGFALALYLRAATRAALLRAIALVPLMAAIWYASLRSTTAGPRLIGHSGAEPWLSGLNAGTVAATGVVVATWLLFPFFRRFSSAAVTLLVGMAFGMLVALPIGWHISLFLTFVVWQAGVTACIGWAVARAKAAETSPPTLAASCI